MVTYGADTDELRRFAAALGRGSDDLRRIEAESRRLLHATPWPGGDGDCFRQTFETRVAQSLRAAAEGLAAASDRARSNADQQQQTSESAGAAGMATPVPSAPSADSGKVASAINEIEAALDTGGWGVTASDLDNIMSIVSELNGEEIRLAFDNLSEDDLRVLKDQMQEGRFKGGWSSEEQRDFLQLVVPHLSADAKAALLGADWTSVTGPDPVPAGARSDVWAGDLFDRMRGADRAVDGNQLPRIAEDEIEVRRLDNGKWMVTLPGVVDLTTALDDLKADAPALIAHAARSPAAALGRVAAEAWSEFEAPNASGSARDMAYARQSEMNSVNGSVDGANGYATAVKFALEAAGVPSGADVMLVGHSFGAYTAAELAADPSFNLLAGEEGHFNVTHVLSGGASAAFRMSDLPEGTDGLLINNANDVPYLVESALPTNSGSYDLEVVFNGSDYPHAAGANAGAGHGETNYGAFMRDSAHPDVVAFRESSFADYGGSGESMRVTVKDPYRIPTD